MDSRRDAVAIPGASSGIGRATGRLLAAQGFMVFTGVRREAGKCRCLVGHKVRWKALAACLLPDRPLDRHLGPMEQPRGLRT